MIFWYHILSFTVICLWHIHAAPQRRTCSIGHSAHASDIDSNSSLPTDIVTDTGSLTTSSAIAVFSASASTNDSSSDGDTFTPADTNPDTDTLTTLTQLLTLGSITPKIVLVYTNFTTTVLPTPALTSTPTPAPIANITTRALFPNTSVPSFTTPSTTRFAIPTTTPDMDAMQTAYYYSVCAWEQHLDDAICLGGNTMLCCRADNERCNAYLMDGGLSCEGIESGNWATIWARKTITLGVDGAVIADSTSTSATSDPTTSLPSSITGVSMTIATNATATAAGVSGGGSGDSMTLDAGTNSISDTYTDTSIDSVTTHLRITTSANPSTSTDNAAGTNTIVDTSGAATTTATLDIYPSMSTSTVSGGSGSGRVKVIPIDQR